MSKELFILAHEQLVEEYIDANPGATWTQAYERTSDAAHDRMVDTLANRIDYVRMIVKEGA